MDSGLRAENASNGKVARPTGFDIKDTRHLSQEVTEVARSGPFPAELLFMIFDHLDKRDYKVIRLVSTRWSAAVTAKLFDIVRFAVHEEELDKFAKLTEHPIISQSITQLDYNLFRFVPKLLRKDYVVSVLHQIDTLLKNLPEDASFDDHDAETRELVELVREAPPNKSWHWRLTSSPILAVGFDKYKRFAKEQKVLLQTQRYNGTLLQGLARLPKLRSIVISNDWQSCCVEDNVETTRTSVLTTSLPSARAWNPLLLYLTTDEECIAAYRTELALLFQALAFTKAPLDEVSFRLSCNDSTMNFYPTPELAGAEWDILLQAYQELKSLVLQFSGFGETVNPLTRMLGSLPHLEQLTINVNYDLIYLCDPSLSELPFGIGSQLHTVWFGGISISFHDLCQFVRTTVQLKSLTLSKVNLFAGSFADVFDILRIDLELTSFRVVCPLLESRRRHIRRGASTNTIRNLEDQIRLYQDIEAYVLYGGLNPLRAPQV